MFNYPSINADLGSIGHAVKKLSELTGVNCNLCEAPGLKDKGFFSMPTLSEDIVRIASKYGISMTPTGDLNQAANQANTLIKNLIEKGVIKASEL